MKIIQMSKYHITPGNTPLTTLYVRKLIESLKDEEDITLEFTKGEYHFYPDYAIEKLLYISNHHEDTLKRIAFDFSNLKGVHIKGNLSNFIFHTEIIPFYINNAINITIEDLYIDYYRTGYSEGIIKNVSVKEMLLSIDKEKYPYKLKNQKLYFIGENYCHELELWLEMTDSFEPVYDTHDLYLNNIDCDVVPIYEDVADNLVKITLMSEAQFLPSSKPGNHLILRHHPRSHPCFYLTDSQEIQLHNITIYHATGMGLIAERSKDITLDHFNVALLPENPTVFTAEADATHFVSCYGNIKISNCLFENQLDDAINIHGIYARIKKIISQTEVILELVHAMHKGVCIGSIGDRIEVIDNTTLLSCQKNRIKDIYPFNKDYIYLKLDTPCNCLVEGFVIENKEYSPDVLIQNCKFQNNRARGILLTTAGKVQVDNCYFHTAGAAILLEGDANYWFESGTTTEIVLKNNVFDNCCYVSDWGHAVIQSTPTIKDTINSDYHKKVVIENNTFYCFDDRLLFMNHVKDVVIDNNKIVVTTAYAPISAINTKEISNK